MIARIIVAIVIGIAFFGGVAYGMSINDDYYKFELSKERSRADKYLIDLTATKEERNRLSERLKEYEERRTTSMKKTNFPDVPEGAWYEDYVKTALDAGIMVGYDDGNFHPDAALKRSEAAKLVSLLLEKIGQ